MRVSRPLHASPTLPPPPPPGKSLWYPLDRRLDGSHSRLDVDAIRKISSLVLPVIESRSSAPYLSHYSLNSCDALDIGSAMVLTSRISRSQFNPFVLLTNNELGANYKADQTPADMWRPEHDTEDASCVYSRVRDSFI
jgi:hypothetical protein